MKHKNHMAMFFIFSMALFCADIANADATHAVDPTQFDIAGVKTGMTKDQAVQAVMDHFHITKDQIKFDPFLLLENPVTHARLPISFAFEQAGSNLLVTFNIKVPVSNADPLVVDSVKYYVPNTPDNVKSVYEAAVQKYGQPSAQIAFPKTAEWCMHPQNGCPSNEALLSQSSTVLYLSDPSYQIALRKAQTAASTTKPNF